MEEFIDLYRYKIYDRCNIMANDLSDIIKEVKLFIDDKIIPYLNEDEYEKLVFDGIELRKNEDGFIWSIHDKNEMIDLNSKHILFNEINNLFKGDKEFLKSLEENHQIENFPKELYGKAFMVFAETVSEIINSDDLYTDVDLFGIFKLDNNGINNIIVC